MQIPGITHPPQTCVHHRLLQVNCFLQGKQRYLSAAFLANDGLVEYCLLSWLKLTYPFSEYLLSTIHVTGSREE